MPHAMRYEEHHRLGKSKNWNGFRVQCQAPVVQHISRCDHRCCHLDVGLQIFGRSAAAQFKFFTLCITGDVDVGRGRAAGRAGEPRPLRFATHVNAFRFPIADKEWRLQRSHFHYRRGAVATSAVHTTLGECLACVALSDRLNAHCIAIQRLLVERSQQLRLLRPSRELGLVVSALSVRDPHQTTNMWSRPGAAPPTVAVAPTQRAQRQSVCPAAANLTKSISKPLLRLQFVYLPTNISDPVLGGPISQIAVWEAGQPQCTLRGPLHDIMIWSFGCHFAVLELTQNGYGVNRCSLMFLEFH